MTNNQQISTDLLYDYLADPNKLKPIKQTAQIIDNDNDSDNHESFIVDFNNNINNETPILNFNSDKNKKSSSSSKKNSTSSINNDLKEKINNDLNNISSESIKKPPTIKPVKSQSPQSNTKPFNANINNIAYQKELKFKKM